MSFIRHYFHEIYSVITLLLITLAAMFVTPDHIQMFALGFMALFLLHEWEETVYPGGFFDALFGEVMNLEPVPSGERLVYARVYVYLMLLLFTLPPFFAHHYAWFILPVAYLGILEGLAHTIVPRVFRLERKYLPGVVTAVCQFIVSIVTFYYLISEHLIHPWQYIVGFLIFVCGFYLMGRCGMATNGINYREVPKSVKKNFKSRRAK